MSVSPVVLTEFLNRAPADKIAVILPEQNLRITYGDLRNQVSAVAEQLAAAGVGRGDRVGTSLTNGLPVIVSFLAAGVAGTAAPLNPAYKEDEFRFYLEDTAAKVLILPPDGADEARRAAVDRGVPILTIDMDAAGTVSLRGARRRTAAAQTGDAAADDRRRRAGAAHQRQHRPAQARAAHAREPVDLGAERRAQLRAHPRRCVAVRDAAVPRARPGGVDAGDARVRRHGRRAGESSARCRSGAPRRDHGVTWYSAVPTLHQLLLARAGDPTDPSRRPAGTEKLRFIRSCSASLPPR